MSGSKQTVAAEFDPDGRMELIVTGEQPGHGAAVDFRRVTLRGISSQPLVRACGERGRLLDATAGLGGDTWVLAAAGFSVTAVERSPVVFHVLRDGVDRAKADSRLATIANRIELRHANATEIINAMLLMPPAQSTAESWATIYLDPMYPPKPGSALAPKPIRIVRDAVGDDLDSATLFLAAVAAKCARIVVKRPHHAEPLCANPDIVFNSKLVRYDVYVREGSSLRTIREKANS